MKLLSFLNEQNHERLGIFYEGKVYDVQLCAKEFNLNGPGTMCEFLKDSLANMDHTSKCFHQIRQGKSKPAHVGKILSPIVHPNSLRDGYAFRQHVETMRKNRGAPMATEFDVFPVYYYSNHNAVTGEGELFIQEDFFKNLDYELELACVIGRKGRNIKAQEADDYILGYTIMNDWSSRHHQLEEMKLSLGPAKGKDFATSLGPWLVTKDELESFKIPSEQGDRFDLRMTAKVNGRLFSEGNAKTMHWTFAQIIERISYGVDLFPGDVIGSGTVGTGCLAEYNGTNTRMAKERGGSFDSVWLKHNDEVTLQIEGLGTLTNVVKSQPCKFHI